MRRGESPGFFVMITWKKQVSIYVFPGLHSYVLYSKNATRAFHERINMEKMTILVRSILVGDGYMQLTATA